MRIMITSRGFNNIAGGVERMSAALMNEMCARGHDVALISWDAPDAQLFFPLDEKITWYKIGFGDFLKKATLRQKLKRARAMRTIVREFRPDIIIGFQDGMFMASRLYTIGMGIPVVAAERNAPSRFDFIQGGRYKDFVFQAMRFAKAITIQCESYRNDYPAYLRHKITTIPNPVQPASKFSSPKGEGQQEKTILSIGRLSYQKNMHSLIKAFAVLAPRFPDWRLLIVGEGEDRKTLEALIQEHNLKDRVQMPGASQDVISYLTTSHILCLPSRWEGFPNVLAEAMAAGLPAVGYANCAGVRDLIENNVTGLLAQGNGDTETLAQALSLLMQADDLRAEMGTAGRTAMAAFQPALIFDQWESFLKEKSA